MPVRVITMDAELKFEDIEVRVTLGLVALNAWDVYISHMPSLV